MKLRDALFIVVHHQRPVLIKESPHRICELQLPGLFRFTVNKSNSEGVLVIKPAKYNIPVYIFSQIFTKCKPEHLTRPGGAQQRLIYFRTSALSYSISSIIFCADIWKSTSYSQNCILKIFQCWSRGVNQHSLWSCQKTSKKGSLVGTKTCRQSGPPGVTHPYTRPQTFFAKLPLKWANSFMKGWCGCRFLFPPISLAKWKNCLDIPTLVHLEIRSQKHISYRAVRTAVIQPLSKWSN